MGRNLLKIKDWGTKLIAYPNLLKEIVENVLDQQL
jgi:hypothetical protein